MLKVNSAKELHLHYFSNQQRLTTKSIQKGINYLLREASHAFDAFEYLDPECIQVVRNVQLLYPLAFGVHALAISVEKGLLEKDLLAETVSLLTHEASPTGTYNYWLRNSLDSQKQTLPDDVDDAAAAYSALFRGGVETPVETFISTLALEKDAGGPYRTWYIAAQAHEKWGDIDPAVNAHFLYLAALNEIYLPNTLQYFQGLIGTTAIKSQYYPGELSTYFYLCKFSAVAHAAGETNLHTELESELKNYSFADQNHLDKLLLALSYSYLNKPVPTNWLAELESWQESDGKVRPLALCHGYSTADKELTYAGNSYAATALWVELFVKVADTAKAKSPNLPVAFNMLIKATDSLLDKETHAQLKIHSVGEMRITQMVYFALQALGKESAVEDPRIQLLLASAICGWGAYHIMDGMLDRQLELSELPRFASLVRASNTFAALLPLEVRTRIAAGYEMTEKFYAWEQTQMPTSNLNPRSYSAGFDYRYIYKRVGVLTQALSCVATITDMPKYSATLEKIFAEIFFLQQMSDDAHDWEEDKQLRIRTYTLNHLFGEKLRNSRQSLAKLFWLKTLPHIHRVCQAKYRKAAKLAQTLPNPTPLLELLANCLTPFEKAKREMEASQKIISLLH
jgi:hypothetical protein